MKPGWHKQAEIDCDPVKALVLLSVGQAVQVEFDVAVLYVLTEHAVQCTPVHKKEQKKVLEV